MTNNPSHAQLSRTALKTAYSNYLSWYKHDKPRNILHPGTGKTRLGRLETIPGEQKHQCCTHAAGEERLANEKRRSMTTRFHLYFPTGTEHLLEEAKAAIPNLSDFLIQAIKARLAEDTQTQKAGISAADIFRKKFGDLESEAYIRQIFPDAVSASQALRNRLTETKRAHTEQFGEVCRLFAAKFPGYAKILEEL